MASKEDIIGTVIILGIFIGIFSIPAYEWSVSWSDTGKVIRVSEKMFDPSSTLQWSYDFSITTRNHGNFTFNTDGTYGPFGCLAINQVANFPVPTQKPIMNATVGIYQTHYGCIEVVNDP